jgi:hypothetical protein
LIRFAVHLAIFSILSAAALAQTPAGSLQATDFLHPPDSAKPRVWWHWMSGNVTQEGITADLEWMHRVGIGGFQMFDGDVGVAQYVQHPLIWMTPEWQAALRHAGEEADRLGLEMAMAASGGWSETAGPWVRPEAGMKKVVWSELVVEGPTRLSVPFPAPPHVNGPFQGIAAGGPPRAPITGGAPGITKAPAPATAADPTYYRDTVVLAYPVRGVKPRPSSVTVTSSAALLSPENLSDGDYATNAELRLGVNHRSEWIQWDFPAEFTAQSFTLGMPQPTSRVTPPLPDGDLSFSADGRSWTSIVDVPDSPPSLKPFGVRTFTFAPVRARYFRLTLRQAPLNADQIANHVTLPSSFLIAEARLFAEPKIAFYEDKASFGTFVAGDDTATRDVQPSEEIAVQDVVDLTGKLRPDGSLDWQVPAGRWVIVRFGYSLTGVRNHPATPAATGLEVDKLSSTYVAEYIKTYTGMISRAVSPYYAKSFRYFLMDSWEAGQENWTDSMLADFRQRRGYDATPYLLALTGRIVGTSRQSDAFLWDYRRTIAELLADNHYKLATDLFSQQHIGLYAEAMGIGLPTTGDGLLNKGQVSVPMAEFWTPGIGATEGANREADVLEAVSAGHIYGKPIIATESFTSSVGIPGWGQTPFYLKALADENFARGVNRIVFHTSVHQPFVDDKHKPGFTLGFYGQHYSRNITWAEQAVVWNEYLARCSYMEQQGYPVVDVAYFYGEGAPVTVPYWKQLSPSLPTGYSRDFINADVLLNRASVKDGDLTLTSGMHYRVLVIPEDVTQLSLDLLRRIAGLVKAGATVIAPRVTSSPSLADLSHAAESRELAEQLWGPARQAAGSHRFGQGILYWGYSLAEVLARMKVAPDFVSDAPTAVRPYDYPSPKLALDLVWNHRRVGKRDVYFIANQRMRSEDVRVKLRVPATTAEVWHPDTGTISRAAITSHAGTEVSLHFEPSESIFLVLGQEDSLDLPRQLSKADVPMTRPLLDLPGPWDVSFPAKLGAPEHLLMPVLSSFTQSRDPGVRYFSGTAIYSKVFSLPADWHPGSPVLLDLGRVREFAEVTVNGQDLQQILWKPPFTIDVSGALKSGQNLLQIRITNLWPNRIIGDRQPDATKHYTFTVYGAYDASSPLTEAGLLGPVRLLQAPSK